MKRHLSVFELAARGAVYKTLIVSLIAAAAAFALMYAIPGTAENLSDYFSGEYYSEPAGTTVKTGAAWAAYVYTAGIFALYVLLSRIGAPKRGVNPDYTFRRLRISEREAACIQAGVHALCFAIYMAMLLAAYVGFSALFLSRSLPYENDGQSLFFAAYTTLPLRRLLPLSEWFQWSALAVTCLACGVGSVTISFWKRRNRVSGVGVAAGIILILSNLFRYNDAGLYMIFIACELLLVSGGLFGSLNDNNAEEREVGNMASPDSGEGGGANASA